MNPKVFLSLALAFWLGCPVVCVRAAVVVTASAPSASGLESVVAGFRTLISQGGTNNGAGGGPLVDGRREVSWDVASLDFHQIPASMPGDFFNSSSLRGLELATTGSLVISGRAASGSPDLLFSTLNPAAAAKFQAYSPDRLLAIYGSTVVEAAFFLPSAPGQRAVVRGFGAVFADVTLFGPTRLEAFGRSGQLLASALVPAVPGGLSFAGVWIEGGEWIDRIRLTLGEAGIEDTSGAVDIVAMDDFLFAEPQLVPEPGTVVLVLAGAGTALLRRRRIRHVT